jgi:hypothetical protein
MRGLHAHDIAPLALSSQPAEPACRRAAMAAVMVSFVLLAGLASFAKEKLATLRQVECHVILCL